MLIKEGMLDHLDDYYIKDLNKIKKQLDDMYDDLIYMYDSITKSSVAADNDRKLGQLFTDTTKNLFDIRKILDKNYEGIKHY